MGEAEPVLTPRYSTVTAANVQNGPVFYENGHACRDKTVPQEKKHDWTWRTMALKKKTLARDGNRCVLTGMADMRWYYNMVCYLTPRAAQTP